MAIVQFVAWAKTIGGEDDLDFLEAVTLNEI